MGPVLEYDEQRQRDPITLDVYPSGESGYTLYEDDGDSYAYRSGKYSETLFTCRESDGRIEIGIGPSKGAYNGKPELRRYELTVHGVTKPARIILDKADLTEYGSREEFQTAVSGWFYRMNNGTRRVLEIKLPALKTAAGAGLRLERSMPVKYYNNY
jgi:hypothetical protein